MRAAVVPNEKNGIRREQVNMEREKRTRKKSRLVCCVLQKNFQSLAHSSHTLSDGFHVQRNAPAFEDRRHCIHSFVLPQVLPPPLLHVVFHPPTHVIVACFLCTRVFLFLMSGTFLPSLPLYHCHSLLLLPSSPETISSFSLIYVQP